MFGMWDSGSVQSVCIASEAQQLLCTKPNKSDTSNHVLVPTGCRLSPARKLEQLAVSGSRQARHVGLDLCNWNISVPELVVSYNISKRQHRTLLNTTVHRWSPTVFILDPCCKLQSKLMLVKPEIHRLC